MPCPTINVKDRYQHRLDVVYITVFRNWRFFCSLLRYYVIQLEEPFLVPDYNFVIYPSWPPIPPSNYWNSLPNKPNSTNYFLLIFALEFYVCFGCFNLLHDNNRKGHYIFILVQCSEKYIIGHCKSYFEGFHEHLNSFVIIKLVNVI